MKTKRNVAIVGLVAISPCAWAANIATDWTGVAGNAATGVLNGVSVSVTAPSASGAPIIGSGIDLSIPAYSGAPLSSSEEVVDYGFDSNWTATFGTPVSDLRLYAKFWRGPHNGPADPPQFEYTFDQPISILSGFTNSSIVGNTLIVPSSSFQDGILVFGGPVSSVSVISNNANSGSRQFLTFGTVPAPSGLALLGVGSVLATRRRR